VLGFPEGSFFQRQASESKYRADIEEHVKSYFGKDAHFSLSTPHGDSNKSIEENKQVEAASMKKQALENPTVVKLQTVLGAEIVDVDLED
jgi:hypothetical protein